MAAKQRALEDALQRSAGCVPDTLLPADRRSRLGLSAPRAAVGARRRKKGGVLVGFHERKSSFVADMRECHVMPREDLRAAAELRALIEALSIRERLPQIELAVGDGDAPIESAAHAMPHRCVRARAAHPRAAVAGRRGEAASRSPTRTACELWLQPGGPETVVPFHPRGATLAYTLPEFDLALPFAPTDFTQVNPAINRVLVRRAVRAARPAARRARRRLLLRPRQLHAADRAPRRAVVVGVEGSKALVARAAARTPRATASPTARRFACANLFAATPPTLAALGRLDRVLIDPPREGAFELVKALPHRRR